MVCNNAGHIADPGPRERSRVSGRSLVIGLLGNLNAEKGLDRFIETLAAGRSRGIDLKGILAGPAVGSDSISTIEHAQRLLGPALDVLGPVYEEAKGAFFRSIDVFVFPTDYIYETQPLVILEAMSYGIPVIAARRGYIAEMMGPSGAVVSQQDDFATATLQILSDFVDEPKMLAAAGDVARAQFIKLRALGTQELSELVKVITLSRGECG
jgi:glycosyltransferase involved in cell wall biosynthesis